MQKLLFSFFALLLAATTLTAQSGEDAYKDARKAYTAYEVNAEDTEALANAVANAEIAMADSEIQSDPKKLVYLGNIYTRAINNYVNNRIIDANAKERLFEQPALKAAKAYMMAYEVADKKGDKKKALEGLTNIQANLTNEGIYAIQDGSTNPNLYGESYEAFTTNLKVTEFLRANGGEVGIDDEAIEKDKFFGALAATLGKDYDSALPLYEELYASGYDDAGVYDGLFRIYNDRGDKEKAYEVLSKGRKLYPEETALLFSEINYLLGAGRLDELTGKLESAIAKEPDNMSLYATLAQVYEQLYKKASDEGNMDAANNYYQQAEKEYMRGLEKDPTSAKMIYGLGAMIYNRGAAMSQELVELGNDFSKEGQKKYEALKTEVDAEFAKALPFFQKAEMADPSDLNTLLALKEMYARQDEYEVSNEFKARIERIQGGETIQNSYFKENGM